MCVCVCIYGVKLTNVAWQVFSSFSAAKWSFGRIELLSRLFSCAYHAHLTHHANNVIHKYKYELQTTDLACAYVRTQKTMPKQQPRFPVALIVEPVPVLVADQILEVNRWHRHFEQFTRDTTSTN